MCACHVCACVGVFLARVSACRAPFSHLKASDLVTSPISRRPGHRGLSCLRVPAALLIRVTEGRDRTSPGATTSASVDALEQDPELLSLQARDAVQAPEVLMCRCQSNYRPWHYYFRFQRRTPHWGSRAAEAFVTPLVHETCDPCQAAAGVPGLREPLLLRWCTRRRLTRARLQLVAQACGGLCYPYGCMRQRVTRGRLQLVAQGSRGLCYPRFMRQGVTCARLQLVSQDYGVLCYPAGA
ncbi:hypothetical protein NDU88_000005 [Pleurodeles waltl]|uniref:Uncharacterized protein n=1 Tax=Pleurodeles waltl TaxID=8319 RepID=A0AAV7KUF2_PLEWA|nr:hypothetical protein NDU88_000005 [Pleurodeles waltl]